MRRVLAWLLVLLMACQGMMAFARNVEAEMSFEPVGAVQATLEGMEGADGEQPETEEPEISWNYDELTVGTVTPFEGGFFSNLWGNVTSDADVRQLLHGYNLIEWRAMEGVFAVDPAVVSGIVMTTNSQGDATYTLTIYDDLYYTDGIQITSRDYAFSLLLSIAPEVAQIGGRPRTLSYLAGYEAYASGESQALAGVRVMDDDTISITVSHEYLPFFYELALLDCVPCPIHVIAPGCRVADDGNGVYIANEDDALEEPVFTASLLRETLLNPETGYLSHPMVTSGPYRLISYDGETVAMEINERYKGNSQGRRPSIRHLYYRVVTSETMIEQLAQGQLGLINKALSAEALQQGTRLIAGSELFTMSNYTRSGLSFLSFCCEREPVSGLAVRQAIAHCLDKDGLVRDAVSGYGLRVDGYYGMGQWMYGLVNGTQAYPVDEPEPEADQETIDAYEAAIAAWESLTLDDVPTYEMDVSEAVRLLISDGWTLNPAGEAFDPAKDEVRCRMTESGELEALELRMYCPQGSSLNPHYQVNFVDHLAQAGIRLSVEEKPFGELLRAYYRQEERDCELIAIASNFDTVFDPSTTFRPDGEEAINTYNPTAIGDEALYELAVDMRTTKPGDTLDYCRKWIAFQQRFQELEPMIPIYSNVYFDFYARVLHEYDITSNVTWSQAIVSAYMSDWADEEEEEEEGSEEEDGEGEDGFITIL